MIWLKVTDPFGLYTCVCVCVSLSARTTNLCAFLGYRQVESVVPWLLMVLQLLREAQQITLDFMDKVSLNQLFLVSNLLCYAVMVCCTQECLCGSILCSTVNWEIIVVKIFFVRQAYQEN